jgi:TatD DNase family protein
VNTAEVLAEVKGVSYAEMADITTENAFRCFSKMPRLS